MSKDRVSSTNIIEFRKRCEADKRQHPSCRNRSIRNSAKSPARRYWLCFIVKSNWPVCAGLGKENCFRLVNLRQRAFLRFSACARMALQAAKRSSGSVASRFRGRAGYAIPYRAAARRIQRRSAACSQRYRLGLSSRSRDQSA